jgi:hypothetical protein
MPAPNIPTPPSTDLIRRWIIDHHRRTGEHPTASTPGGRWAEAEDHLRELGSSLDAMVRAMRVGGWFGPEPKVADPASSPTFAGVGWAEAWATLGPATSSIAAAKPGPGSEGPFTIIFTAGDKILAEFPPPEGDGIRASRSFDRASVKVDVSCGPIDLIFNLVGPTRSASMPDVEWLALVRSAGRLIGSKNAAGSFPGFAEGTLKLRDVFEESGHLVYDFAHRRDGWPDLEPADFSTLYPDGPVPQQVHARAECDVFARAGKDGKPAFLARYRSDEAVLIGEIEADG